MRYLLLATKSDTLGKTKFDLVARFSTEKKAKDYIQKSKLKKRIKRWYIPDVIFKEKSLLRNYYSAYVEVDRQSVDVPFDPK